MGTDNPVNRPPAHQVLKMCFPDRFTVAIADTRINNHPFRTILKRPEIDMIKTFHRESKA